MTNRRGVELARRNGKVETAFGELAALAI